MEAPVEGNVDMESCNESDDGRKKSENRLVPAYMRAVMRRQFLQEMIKNLPAPMQNRVTMLKNIQKEHLLLEAEFFEEVYKLEKKYQEQYQPLFNKRRDIVTGVVEPGKAKATWKSDEEATDGDKVNEFSEILKELQKTAEDAKGIPDFWLTILRNTEILSEMVQEHDEPVVKKLTDIKIVTGILFR